MEKNDAGNNEVAKLKSKLDVNTRKEETDARFEHLPEESKAMVNLCREVEKWRDEMRESGKIAKWDLEHLIYVPIDRNRVYSNVGADTKEWTRSYIGGYWSTYHYLQSCSQALEECKPQIIKEKIATILKQIESDSRFLAGEEK